MASSEKYFNIWKALAWSACNKMKTIWSSNLSRNFKIRLFRATVESVLLYNSETWTINKSLEKRIDGCYTRMLRMALNVTWKMKITNETLYQELPKFHKQLERGDCACQVIVCDTTMRLPINWFYGNPQEGEEIEVGKPSLSSMCFEETQIWKKYTKLRQQWRTGRNGGNVSCWPK